MKQDTFWDKFYKRPIDQIPWQNVLYVFSEDQIRSLFPKFKIVKKNISQSEKPPKPGIYFLELLMVKS